VSELRIRGTRLLQRTLDSKARVIIHRGGTRSSKSYSIAQWIVVKFFSETRKRFLVTRATFPALRMGAMKDVIDVMREAGLYDGLIRGHRVVHNKSENTIRWNGNEIVFASLDDPQKFRGPGWNYAWFNEANEIAYEGFRQVLLRLSNPSSDGAPNQIVLDFNPDDPYVWIKEKLEDRDRAEVIVSSYRDNPFLPEETVREIEQLEAEDPEFWEIFGLGEYGTRNRDLIFTDWILADGLIPLELTDDRCFGLDFGYSQSQTALVEIRKQGAELWEEELVYQTGLTNSDLIEILLEIIPASDRHVPIYADPAEPQRIEEISRAGFNILPAEKAVKTGIDFARRFRTHITERSLHLLQEIKLYKWRQDRNGRPLEEPVKFRDHLMDARRYAIFTHGRQIWSEHINPFLIPDLTDPLRPKRREDDLFHGYPD
jgi:phage terminase large subunit